MEEVTKFLLCGDLESAAERLLHDIYSSDSLHEWSKISKHSSALHHALSFVSSLAFTSEECTAYVEIDSGNMVIGVDFFLSLTSLSDLFFVLLHERGHVLIDLVHGSWMDSFSSFEFGNMWEDQYINDSVSTMIHSDLCFRVYEKSKGRYRDLKRQNFPLWFSKNMDWLKFCLPSNLFHLLHKTHLAGDPISLSIPYTSWMKIGLILERSSDDESNGIPASDGEGTGDFLSALSGVPNNKRKGDKVTDLPQQKGVGSGSDVSSLFYPGVESSPIAKVLMSFTPEVVPSDCRKLLDSLSFIRELDSFVSNSLVGDVISSFGPDPVITGRTGSLSSLHRRDAFYLAAGIDPTTWTVEMPLSSKKLKLYFDVSGSMRDYFPVVFFIQRYLSDYVDQHFHFSTVVVEVDPNETSLRTTGGTSYDAVASHILENGYTDVIVVTDNTDNISEPLRNSMSDSLRSLYLLQTNIGYFSSKGFNCMATSTLNLPSYA